MAVSPSSPVRSTAGRGRLFLAALLAGVAAVQVCAGQAATDAATQLPEGTHRDTVQRACSACHSVQMFSGRRMSRQQWGATVSSMVARGAKVSDDEFDEIVGYLAATFPLSGSPSSASSAAGQKKAPRRPSLIDQAGSADKQVVDEDAALRGKTVYIAQCITCHGTRARGGSRGADLVRSVVVLHDRYGSTLGPYLAAGHPKAKPVSLTPEQVKDLSHFLQQQIGDTLRTGPYNNVLNVMVGDATAGKVYFETTGGCVKCHSVTGDLAHIASRYDPPVLQQRVVFPQNRAITKQGTASRQLHPLTVRITTAAGESVTGQPLNIDDFDVSLRDASGRYFSFRRTPDLKVDRIDPYAAHEALLDRYTDRSIHDLVAYLETLQ